MWRQSIATYVVTLLVGGGAMHVQQSLLANSSLRMRFNSSSSHLDVEAVVVHEVPYGMRTGNQLQAMIHALVHAEYFGSPAVVWDEHIRRHMNSFFNLPRVTYITPEVSALSVPEIYTFDIKTNSPDHFLLELPGIPRQEYARVAQTYLMPLLHATEQEEQEPSNEHSVTIHLRWDEHLQEAFESPATCTHRAALNYVDNLLPCSAYHDAIREFNFTDIRILTQQADHEHPCLSSLSKLPYAKVIWSESDAISEIVTAKNLMISDSTFSKAFMMLNSDVKRVFTSQLAVGGARLGEPFEVGGPTDPLGSLGTCIRDEETEITHWHLYNSSLPKMRNSTTAMLYMSQQPVPPMRELCEGSTSIS